MRSTNLFVFSAALAVLSGAWMLGTGGCAAIATAVAVTAPEPTTDAAFTPPKDDTLVLVEDFKNPSSSAVISELLDRQVAYDLVENHVVPVINPDTLFEFRQSHSKTYSQMEIASIGRAVGAKQVIYANLVDFQTEQATGASMARGHGEARVRLIDVATGQTRWPQDVSEGYPVTAQTPFIPLHDGTSERTVEQKVAQELSEKIARLFHKYQSDHLQTNDLVAPIGGE